MTIRSRTYQDADDLAKIQAFIGHTTLIDGNCGKLHVGDIPHRLYNNMRGRALTDCVRLWEDPHNELLGFAIISMRHKAFDFMLHHDYWDHGLGDEIVDWCVDTIQTRSDEPAAELKIGAEVDDCDERRAALLERHGFSRRAPLFVYTTRSLIDDIPASRLPEGFLIRSATGVEEAGKLAEAHQGAFNSQWTAEEYQRVMESPGYDPKRELVVVAPDGRFAAFCVIWLDILNKQGLFEPVGTHPDFQRQGIGRALMVYGLREMQAQGIKTGVVLHETDNPASTALYKSLGFLPKYTICDYVKTINQAT
jgi:ribosomal protein S18 acetylase RimI-like enzyme